MIAAVGNTPYNIVLVLHILTALAAFAPAFVHPILNNQMKSMAADQRRTVLGHMVGNGRRIYGPAVILTGLFGFALSGMSDSVYSMSQSWLVLAAIIWIAINGILHAVVFPAERAVADGDDSAAGKVDIGGMAISALLVITVILMVFKPGA